MCQKKGLGAVCSFFFTEYLFFLGAAGGWGGGMCRVVGEREECLYILYLPFDRTLRLLVGTDRSRGTFVIAALSPILIFFS